jgi:D-alanine-D-alanine ligase
LKNILLLFGGHSYEHEVSCLSAKNIYNNINKNIFNVITVYVSKDNIWYIFNNEFDNINEKKLEEVKNLTHFIKKFDCIFNIIHGNDGEDGKYISLFEILGIKYVGPNHISSMLSMNKHLTKIILDKYKINQVNYCIYEDNLSYIQKKLNYPMIVKPSNGGSSIGISKVNNKRELKSAIKNAKKFDSTVIIEEFIYGLELECAVLQNKCKLHVSTVGQIKSANEFYDYDSKYINNNSKTFIPAYIPENISNRIKLISKKVFTILGCKDLSRIDYFYDFKNNLLYLNEINTLPGFTDISMYPKLLNYDGYSYEEIITILINNNISL